MGGGGTHWATVIDVAITSGPVDAPALCADAPDGACGAEAVFLGRTRAEDHPEHGGLRALVYEAYEAMAVSVIRSICAEVAGEVGAERIVVRHSVGEVRVGLASVGVRVLAGHRDEAFRACRAVIDRLKLEAPIWKREVWESGVTWPSGVRP